MAITSSPLSLTSPLCLSRVPYVSHESPLALTSPSLLSRVHLAFTIPLFLTLFFSGSHESPMALTSPPWLSRSFLDSYEFHWLSRVLWLSRVHPGFHESPLCLLSLSRVHSALTSPLCLSLVPSGSHEFLFTLTSHPGSHDSPFFFHYFSGSYRVSHKFALCANL